MPFRNYVAGTDLVLVGQVEFVHIVEDAYLFFLLSFDSQVGLLFFVELHHLREVFYIIRIDQIENGFPQLCIVINNFIRI